MVLFVSDRWKKACVDASVSLGEAMSAMDLAALRIALIVDPRRRLVGTLTDGDVRRALLAGAQLNGPVSWAMNGTPKVASPEWSEEEISNRMQKYNLIQMPVVDTDGCILDLAVLGNQKTQIRYDNPVFLMAGGFGKRLGDLTENCPKPMLEIGGRPILERLLLNFIRAGFYRFYISTHFKPEVIVDYFGNGSQWNAEIQYVHEEEPLGTAGALGLLPKEEIGEPFFMMNGDIVTSLDPIKLLEFSRRQSGAATICVREYKHQVPFGVISSINGKLASIVEKPENTYHINAGIYMLDASVLDNFDMRQRIDMPDFLQQQMAMGREVNLFPIYEPWLDIGRPDDFAIAEKLYRNTE